MFLELVLIGGIFALGYRATRKARPFTAVGSITLATRAEQAGDAGEQIAQTTLIETLDWLCGSDYYLHNGPLIIEHAPGSPFPTAEIDHLAVTPFGVFVFETKHWSGHISNTSGTDQLCRTSSDGTKEIRKSPLAQNTSKVAFLRRRLPTMWPVEGAGIFTSEKVSLAPDLPLGLFRVDDLPQWLRQKKASWSGKIPVDVTRATAAILRFADESPSAAEQHRKRAKQSFQSPDNDLQRGY